MIQGGDPTGSGRGGESIWGKPFKDEFNSKLVHSGRGVVSMANSGPHTNGSQFFILYKSANHLNFKHTVFGMVVGGLPTLSAMEKVPVDDDDRPLVCILYDFICFACLIFNLLLIYLGVIPLCTNHQMMLTSDAIQCNLFCLLSSSICSCGSSCIR